MKNNKLIANSLFWMTIATMPIAFSISTALGEAEIFGVAGIVRYSWIMLLFLPVCFLSFLVGKKLKNVGQNYKKLYTAVFICVPLLLIFGSYRFIFQDISYDSNDIYAIEQKVDIDLPDAIKVALHDYAGYSAGYVKITDAEEAADFAKEIETDNRWTQKLSTAVKGLLPLEIQAEMSNFDYFMLFDLSSCTYNEYPADGEYKCVFMAYDHELQRLIILDDYIAEVNR